MTRQRLATLLLLTQIMVQHGFTLYEDCETIGTDRHYTTVRFQAKNGTVLKFEIENRRLMFIKDEKIADAIDDIVYYRGAMRYWKKDIEYFIVSRVLKSI